MVQCGTEKGFFFFFFLSPPVCSSSSSSAYLDLWWNVVMLRIASRILSNRDLWPLSHIEDPPHIHRVSDNSNSTEFQTSLLAAFHMEDPPAPSDFQRFEAPGAVESSTVLLFGLACQSHDVTPLQLYLASNLVNPLMGTLNRKATDHYTALRWLVHWSLKGGLLYLVQWGEAWAGYGPARSPPRCTAHPLRASVLTSYYLM